MPQVNSGFLTLDTDIAHTIGLRHGKKNMKTKKQRKDHSQNEDL
jgi:hypothetical protein